MGGKESSGEGGIRCQHIPLPNRAFKGEGKGGGGCVAPCMKAGGLRNHQDMRGGCDTRAGGN